MRFQSLTYLFFLAGVFALFWVLPQRTRKPLLFVASMFFYCWFKWEYGFLLMFVIVITFVAARVARTRSRPAWAWASIVVILLVLFFYKYLNFFIGVVNDAGALVGAEPGFDLWNIILPLGISFFVFQAISYVVDCVRDPDQEIESFLDYALYISFWPQLVAGPIMRAGEMVPQFNKPAVLTSADFKEGCRRIIQGLFMKLALADGISKFVDEGFLNYAHNTMLDNWTLSFAFGFQIFFDFAGYSSVAVGSALLFGYRLVENFDFPYAATNPREFWQRWHVSLSSWIRDYLYMPLMSAMTTRSRSTGGIDAAAPGGSFARRANALFISWAIMGFWHGANWTFVFWGLWHAVVVMLYRAYCRAFPPPAAPPPWYKRYWGIIPTIALIMPGWIFFRAESLPQAFTMLAGLVDFASLPSIGYSENYYLATFMLTAGFFVVYFIREARLRVPRLQWIIDAAVYAALATCVLAFFERVQPFIYFQF